MAHRVFAKYLASLVLAFGASAVHAAGCTESYIVETLPKEITSPDGVIISYTYNLEAEEYFLNFVTTSDSFGPYGPFIVQRNCQPPAFIFGNDDFLIFEAGCGSRCWFYDIYSISERAKSEFGVYQTIYSPLSFDASRNLLAVYPKKDVVSVTNLITGVEERLSTPY